MLFKCSNWIQRPEPNGWCWVFALKFFALLIFRPLAHFAINCRCRVGRWRTHSVAHPAIPWTHSCICGGRGNQQLRAEDRKLQAQNAEQRNSIRLLIRTQFPQPAGQEMRDYVLDRLRTVSLTAKNAKEMREFVCGWFNCSTFASFDEYSRCGAQHFFVVFSLSQIT